MTDTALSSVIGQSMFPDAQWAHLLEQQLPPGPPGPHATQVPMPQQWPQQPPPQAPPQQSAQPPPPQRQQQTPTVTLSSDLEALLLGEGITRGTIQRLIDNGFATTRALKLLDKEDVESMGIAPLGQRKTLLDICGSLHTTAQAQKVSTTANTAEVTIAAATSDTPTSTLEKRLEQLFIALPPGQQQHQTQARPINTAGEVAALNPLFHLLPPGSTKYHQIVKFIDMGEEEEQEELWGDGERKIIFRAGAKRLQLHQVSPMQWCGANVRILMELLRERSLAPENIVDYLAYTAKISDLAAVYKWGSVLLFDDRYRRAQAENGFRWGSDSPHVDRICLRFKELKREGGEMNKKPRLCINFQYNKCTRGKVCPFRHVCSAPGCGKNHGLIHHDHKDQHNKDERLN